MHELMSDPTFAAYMDAEPRATIDYGRGVTREHPGLTGTAPWLILANLANGRTGIRRHDTWTDAHDAFKRALDRDGITDVTVVARRMFFAPPGHWVPRKRRVTDTRTNTTRTVVEEVWTDSMSWPGYEWCPRCRRPSEFRELPPDHHAFRLVPVRTIDDPYRCITCGIRRAALPPNPDLLMIVETS
jgi:hypothetical protein